MAQLTTAEQDQLEALIDGAHDRPATWAQNLLCFGYGLCRAPLTGGDPNRAPMIQHLHPPAPNERSAWLKIQPNPASTWVVVNYGAEPQPANASISIRDLMGREVHRAAISAATGQLLWDTRQVPAGSYAVVLLGAASGPVTQQLIVQP
ncbi:MAG: T9SS type A sorting domain-containing protein [Flavobacteriales bacterium]|nr:T9SS type A sorting domain-containing protein [Flavobacteriales bacterium]